MRIIIPLLCALVGVARGASSASVEAPVALILDATVPLPSEAAAALHREVESIFRETGYSFHWVNRSELKAEDSFADLVVIRLKSACRSDLEVRLAPAGSHAPLGWAHSSEGEILPFIEVDCARLGRMLRASSRGESEVAQRQMMGRALGRVLSHELYHVLTGSSHHAHSGIAQAALTPTHLTRSALAFTARELSLLTRRSYSARQTQPPVSTLSEEPVFESGR